MNRELKFYTILLIVICSFAYTISIMMTNFSILTFGTPVFMLIYSVAGYSPSIAAIFTIKKYYRRTNDLKLFIKSIINIKQKPLMYLYTISAPIVLWITAYVVFRIQVGNLLLLQKQVYSFIWLIPAMIIGGGLEEVGWRGYLLPKLSEKFSPTISTLIVGIVWSIWHLPMWLITGSPQQNLEFFPFALSCIATSFVMTPLYYKTRSIWLCILLHAIDNACFYVFSVAIDSNYITSIFTLIISVLLFYIFMNIFECNKNHTQNE